MALMGESFMEESEVAANDQDPLSLSPSPSSMIPVTLSLPVASEPASKAPKFIAVGQQKKITTVTTAPAPTTQVA